MAEMDYYAILGIARGADAGEVKRAYRKLAMKMHPDRNPGDAQAEAMFKDINEAYDVLKDDRKRAAYDRFGHSAFNQGTQAPGGAGVDINEIFAQMFGHAMGGRRGPQRGGDIRADISVSMEEAFAGVTAGITVPSRVPCGACGGTGSRDRSGATDECPACRGTGKSRTQRGVISVETACGTCGGRGKVVRVPCPTCRGAGTSAGERTLKVRVPAGIGDGTRILVGGEGGAGGGGMPAGDLYVHVSVRAHPIFRRSDNSVFCDVSIRMAQAALGCEIDVPTIEGGKVRVKIPAGVQNGSQMRVPGRGFPSLQNSVRGDMFLNLSVETTRSLSPRQRELLKEFETETGPDGHPASEGFLSRVREFFAGTRH